MKIDDIFNVFFLMVLVFAGMAIVIPVIIINGGFYNLLNSPANQIFFFLGFFVLAILFVWRYAK